MVMVAQGEIKLFMWFFNNKLTEIYYSLKLAYYLNLVLLLSFMEKGDSSNSLVFQT